MNKRRVLFLCTSKTLEPLVDQSWDYIITVCDGANVRDEIRSRLDAWLAGS